MTVNVADSVFPAYDALKTYGPDAVGLAVIVSVALVFPAGTVTWNDVNPPWVIVTMPPPVGAAEESVTVAILEAPAFTVVGLNANAFNAGPVVVTVNTAALVAEPVGVATATLPVVDPVATIAVTEVADNTVTEVATVPLTLTVVVVPRLVPVIVIFVPTGPDVGVKEVIVGAAVVTVNDAALVPVPPDVITEIFPVVAPAGTTAFSDVAETDVTEPETVPLNFTHVMFVRFVPVIVTTVPAGPVIGVKDVIVGGSAGARVLTADVAVMIPSVEVTL